MIRVESQHLVSEGEFSEGRGYSMPLSAFDWGGGGRGGGHLSLMWLV